MMMRDSSASLKAHRYAHSSAVSATVPRRFHTSWIYSKIVWYSQLELYIKPRVCRYTVRYRVFEAIYTSVYIASKTRGEIPSSVLFNDVFCAQRKRIQFNKDKMRKRITEGCSASQLGRTKINTRFKVLQKKTNYSRRAFVKIYEKYKF